LAASSLQRPPWRERRRAQSNRLRHLDRFGFKVSPRLCAAGAGDDIVRRAASATPARLNPAHPRLPRELARIMEPARRLDEPRHS
jgi:hypothetical protein